MKKILLAAALVMTIGLGASAQRGNDTFFSGYNGGDVDRGESDGFVLPSVHGSANDYTAPLGNGLIVLTALGAGYALRKRNK